MRRVAYISRSLIDASDAVLDAMVSLSSIRNAAVGITGMLWSDDTYFVQVLEGEHDCVGKTLGRIRADRRHTDLEVVFDREVRSRIFGEWGMIRPDDGPKSMASTAFLVGLSLTQRGHAARQLHDTVVACAL
jgi:hypothetical protein